MEKLTFPNNEAKFTKTELRIIDYIYQNINSFALLSIGQLSSQLAISEATISRFVRHAGFHDYKELKSYIMTSSTKESPAQKIASTLNEIDKNSIIGLLQYQQYCLEKTISYLEEDQVLTAVSSMISAKKIYLYGKGASFSLAKLLHFRLSRFGTNVILLPTGGSELFEVLAHITNKDLVLIFGFQKTPKEANVLLKHKSIVGYQTILISSRLYQSDESPSDINLYVYRGEVTEYHSMAAPVALIDALVILIAGQMGNDYYTKLSDLYELKELYKSDIPR